MKSLKSKISTIIYIILVITIIILFIYLPEQQASINPDKTLNINGKKVFPTIMYYICDQWDESKESCATSMSKVGTNYTIDYWPASSGAWWTSTHQPAISGYPILVGYNPSSKAPTALSSDPRFFFYAGYDEPTINTVEWNTYKNYYTARHADDPTHPLFTNVASGVTQVRAIEALTYSDGLLLSNYPNLYDWIAPPRGNNPSYIGYGDMFYSMQSFSINTILGGHEASYWPTKPIYQVCWTMGADLAEGFFKLTEQEQRVCSWIGITMNFSGAAFYTYKRIGSGSDVTLTMNNNALQEANKIAGEIRGLNDVLVLPTQHYQHFNYRDTFVSFDKELTSIGYPTGHASKNLNYMYKINGSTHYLIVANADNRGMTNVKITISGLAGSGIYNATTLGTQTTGSSRAGRTYTVNNGVFLEPVIDGFAVHIYKIDQGIIGTVPPQIPSVTSWGNTKSNDKSTSISLNISESVTLNFSASQSVTGYWTKDGTSTCSSSLSCTISWPTYGTKSVTAYGSNSNGSTTTITWTVQVASPTQIPSITSWGNTKSNDKSTSISLNISESVTLNFAASQSITGYWTKDGTSTCSSSLSCTISWSTNGTKSVTAYGSNSNGSTTTITWTVQVASLPQVSSKIGIGGVRWSDHSTMNNLYADNEYVKPGSYRDNFDDGTYDFGIESGHLSIVNGKLQIIGDTTAKLNKTIISHSDVAMFVSINETNPNAIKEWYVRADTSRASLLYNYYGSLREDGTTARIVSYENTTWIDLNISKYKRTANVENYCILKTYGINMKLYCSNISYSNALSNLIGSGTNSLYSSGNNIGLGVIYNSSTPSAVTTFDDIRVLKTDSNGNILHTGDLTAHYETDSNNVTESIIVNSSANADYTLEYRQYQTTNPWILLGTNLSGNQEKNTINGSKYRNTEIRITSYFNDTSSPEIRTIEFSTKPAAVYPRYDVDHNGIVDINDLILISQHLDEAVSVPYPSYDVNMDGKVNVYDITSVAQKFGAKY